MSLIKLSIHLYSIINRFHIGQKNMVVSQSSFEKSNGVQEGCGDEHWELPMCTGVLQ